MIFLLDTGCESIPAIRNVLCCIYTDVYKQATLAMTGTVGKERVASYEGGATPLLSRASFGDGSWL